MEKETEVKKLKEQLAKLTEEGSEAAALAEYKAAVNELAELETQIQAAQKKHNEALGKLQRVLIEKKGQE